MVPSRASRWSRWRWRAGSMPKPAMARMSVLPAASRPRTLSSEARDERERRQLLLARAGPALESVLALWRHRQQPAGREPAAPDAKPRPWRRVVSGRAAAARRLHGLDLDLGVALRVQRGEPG